MKLAFVVILALIAIHASADSLRCFTSTREVTAIVLGADGGLSASTRGGVLHLTPDGKWSKETTLDGLPSNEVLGLEVVGGAVKGVFGKDHHTSSPGVTAETVWNGKPCRAMLLGIEIGGRTIALPRSTGTHVSAMSVRGGKLVAAMFGDGLYEWDGRSWIKLIPQLPENAREVTAVAANKSDVWVGTRRAGLWHLKDKKWAQHLEPDEPFDHDCQCLYMFNGKIYISTLEDGLVVRTGSGWSRIGVPEISSNSPRQMAELGSVLYLRHGDGKVDGFDGKTWRKDIFGALPRKQASTLASDGSKLYVGEWGGWSEFDGSTWRHFLDIDAFQGTPITCIVSDGGRLWVGTQGKGLAEVDQSTHEVKWHDERLGMSDDWIRCLEIIDGRPLVGTFVGGLASWDGVKWSASTELAGQEVTSIAADGSGGAYIGSRFGLWKRDTGGKLSRALPSLTAEVQSLLRDKTDLWIGSRTGIYQMMTLHSTP